MKKTTNLKTTFVYTGVFCLLAGSLLLYSCTNTDKPEDVQGMTDNANYVNSINAKEKDTKFLVTAANINLEEIQLGKLAQNRAMMPDIKDMGRMLESDHSKAQEDLKKLATEKQVNLPKTLSEDGQATYKKMEVKNSREFDKDYVDMMIKRHKNAIDKFKEEVNTSKDEDIKKWAVSMLSMLQAQVDNALKYQKEYD